MNKIIKKAREIREKKLDKRVKDILLGNELADFICYLKSPWRIMWANFMAGIFRGLGIIVGMTIVLTLLVWFLSKIVDFPFIGQYFLDMKNLLEGYIPNGNYR